MKLRIHKEKWHEYMLFSVLFLLFLFFSSRAILDSYLWFDEAGQFYISKGLFHYSDPYSLYGGIAEVLFYNRFFNLDPGGFSVILHFWSMISNQYIWLRILPLIFYGLSIFIVYKWALSELGIKFSSLAVCSIILLYPAFTISSCELRAYSMEMLGVVLSLYLLQKNDGRWNVTRLCLVAAILSVFMTSRYSFVLYSFGFSLYIVYSVLIKEFSKRSIISLLVYGCILVVAVAVIFVCSGQYHLGNGITDEISYVSNGYIANNLRALFSFSCLRFYLLLIIYFYELKKKRKVSSFVLLGLVVSAVFFCFSLLGLFPMDERRSMSLTTIQCLAIITWGLKRIKIKRSVISGGIVCCSIIMLFLWPMLNENRDIRHKEYHAFLSLLKEMKEDETIFVSSGHAPCVRYAFEEGDLRSVGREIYLGKIYLGKGKEHRNSAGKVKNVEITAEDVDATYYFFHEEKRKKVDRNIYKPIKDKSGIFQRRDK
ncbi:MAG: glycosyltransferase family 39 protein [Paludibacteraceae bacterium]|nr:glycosyltransferase family 39 protein [Paludibacteraceae bacterium]